MTREQEALVATLALFMRTMTAAELARVDATVMAVLRGRTKGNAK